MVQMLSSWMLSSDGILFRNPHRPFIHPAQFEKAQMFPQVATTGIRHPSYFPAPASFEGFESFFPEPRSGPGGCRPSGAENGTLWPTTLCPAKLPDYAFGLRPRPNTPGYPSGPETSAPLLGSSAGGCGTHMWDAVFLNVF